MVSEIRTLSKMAILVMLLITISPAIYLSPAESTANSSKYSQASKPPNGNLPTINDDRLKVELVFTGLKFPTGMAFLSINDILVTEKNNGMVKRIINGNLLEEPLIDIAVANSGERGLLGIGVRPDENKRNPTYVFLFFTESSNEQDGSDYCERANYCQSGNPAGHRLYRYELRENKLMNPLLLLDLPANPGADHIGGYIVIGPDKKIYLVTGDGNSCLEQCKFGIEDTVLNAQSANVKDGELPHGRGGILTLSQEGLVMNEGILGNEHPLNLYYAYGIRNSFGMDFDPLTGNLWDVENGPGYGDEINLVKSGFNSGWIKAQGMWPVTSYELLNPGPTAGGYFFSSGREDDNDTNDNHFTREDEGNLLVDFNGKGRYSSPEFTWNMTVSPTALKFLDSDMLGNRYQNDIFVGDFKNGNIYHFDMNKERNALDLGGPLDDMVANNPKELQEIIFGQGFGGITDIEVGPDGYLYIVSFLEGKIFKIVHNKG